MKKFKLKPLKTDGSTTRVGIETLTANETEYWNKKGVTFKPILEYKPLTKDEEDRLKTEYYEKNNRVGFEKLYAAVRQPNGKTKTGKQQFSPSLRQVQAWLAQQQVAQDYKPVRKPKEVRPILVSKVNDLVQMDYLVLTEDLTYNKHRHILNAIDVLSKKAYSRSPVTPAGTAPTAAQTLKLAKEIFEEIKAEHGSYPKRLQTDNGAHFLSSFEKAFEPNGELSAIKYSSGMRYRATSQAVVERFNQTLRNMIRRFTMDEADWVSQLQQFVSNYNNNRHTTLRMTPNQAAKADVGDADVGPKTETQVKLQEAKDRLKEKAKVRNKNLMVLNKGDKVRLVNFKKAKDQGQYKDEPNWWPEVYEIYHVFQSKVGRAPMYSLEPNPPTTIVGNRPGYKGESKSARRRFSVYELQVVGRLGEKHSESIAVSRSVDTQNKIAEEEPEPVKGKPTKAQKPPVKKPQGKPQPVRKSTRTKTVNPLDIVGKIIKVKFDNNRWYTGEVRSYLNGEHKVYYPYDQLTESQNFFFPDKPNFVGRGSWKLV
jgi:transposase InsO family protein